jgi:Ca2+-dependent lipid-binding protein
MENWIGLLKIHVQKGVNLAVRDVIKRSSDPYIIFQMGTQVIKQLLPLFASLHVN